MPKKFYTLTTFAAILILTLDQWAKHFFKINKYKTIFASKFFNLEYFENTGIAFSIQINRYLIIISTFLILIILCTALYKLKNQKIFTISIALIISGSLSNLYDRISLGYVIDYIDIYKYPAFNIADAAITIGAVSLFIKLIKDEINNNKQKFDTNA